MRVAVTSGDERVEVAGTGFGPRNEPHLVSVYGQSFNLEFADHFAFFRYARPAGHDRPRRHAFGEDGVNIVSAAVGAEAGARAVMAVTTDAPCRRTSSAIAATDGFHDGRAVDV